MKKLIYILAGISLLMLACNFSSIATPTSQVVPPSQTATHFVEIPAATSTESPTEAIPPVIANLTCGILSLYLDPLLATGYSCETIPESSEGMEIYPEYLNLTLGGYTLANKFFEPHISVFPLQRYDELIPNLVPDRVSALQNLAGGGAPGNPLPFLPTFNAAQVFYAQYQALPSASGAGIRYLTEYAQYLAPVNNNDLFYTYQGVTADGKYWVSAILPVNHSILPADAVNPPGGMSWEEFSNNFSSYIEDMIDQLNTQPSGSFTPSLDMLDALCSSITIAP
jgi:hypothetical protein